MTAKLRKRLTIFLVPLISIGVVAGWFISIRYQAASGKKAQIVGQQLGAQIEFFWREHNRLPATFAELRDYMRKGAMDRIIVENPQLDWGDQGIFVYTPPTERIVTRSRILEANIDGWQLAIDVSSRDGGVPVFAYSVRQRPTRE